MKVFWDLLAKAPAKVCPIPRLFIIEMKFYWDCPVVGLDACLFRRSC
jgi:hypothetical protein